MTGDPSIGVIVVNYNSAAFIREFCASFRALLYPSLRLVVVDAGSQDDSLALIERELPHARIIRCGENVGFAAGGNIGIAEHLRVGCDYLLFLNNDLVLEPRSVDHLVAAADARTMVVPKILYYHDRRLISTHAGGFDWTLGVFRNTYAGKPDGPATNARRDGIATASFCCALVPAAAFRDAGRLDERFFMYYEETDFIRRAQHHGYRIRYEPSAIVYHRESGASGGGWMTPFKQYYATRNRPFLVKKHATSTLRYAWFTGYFLATRIGASGRLVLRREWRLLRAMWLGVRDYYLGRMGRTLQVKDL